MKDLASGLLTSDPNYPLLIKAGLNGRMFEAPAAPITDVVSRVPVMALRREGSDVL
ncbi:hypothetical protein [Chryseolinea sp. H1M3-3]|uniref:hypothetical protein n=1 Tax=Chryseolinea sp. H1M3-3 TaxID=3034144 RepID=UPI0023ED07FC|nr:hypothetical protein [Chryseolinea sp. H1M3-3]